jgi:protoheme IX farnesyltransferase
MAGGRVTVPGDLVALCKPRMVAMILAATSVGSYLATRGPLDGLRLACTLAGTALAAAGTLALNQVLERDLDARMERTRLRPLACGRVSTTAGLALGTLLTACGLLALLFLVNPLCAAVTAAIPAAYLFLYTPLKRLSAFCTLWGGVPGALPPVAGWAAVRGSLDTQAGVLFAILFLWQLPHALAIACRYREDYARAGIRLLPTVEPGGASTRRQVVLNSLALLAAGLVPTLVGMAGPVYFVAALLLGLVFLGFGVALSLSGTPEAARRLEVFSLVHLPLLFAAMALDRS